jgi:O-6-methylguanine DNA methyltransferase
MTIDIAVVEWPLGTYRARIEEGVVRVGTFDKTPQPLHDDRFGVAQKLRAYFGGDVDALDEIAADGEGSAFQRDVWKHLREVRAGTTVSYGELAAIVGKPTAARAVGMANATNPIALIVPCHRVIRTGGALGGYYYGLEYKRWLLEHEGAAAGVPALPGVR